MTELKGQARVGAERRQAIVDAAMEVFAQSGFRASALADVADRVGMSAAGILYHFGSKDALLLAVIAERDRRASGEMADLPVEGGLDSLARVVRFAEMSEQEPGLASLHTVLQMESVDPNHPAHRYFLRRSRILQKWTAATLDAAKSAGEIAAPVDTEALAQQIVAFLEGAAVLWLVDNRVSLVSLYRGYFDPLIASLRSAAHRRGGT